MLNRHKPVIEERLPSRALAKNRYALKALLELAALLAGATLSSAAISAWRTISVKFLETILVELKCDGSD